MWQYEDFLCKYTSIWDFRTWLWLPISKLSGDNPEQSVVVIAAVCNDLMHVNKPVSIMTQDVSAIWRLFSVLSIFNDFYDTRESSEIQTSTVDHHQLHRLTKIKLSTSFLLAMYSMFELKARKNIYSKSQHKQILWKKSTPYTAGLREKNMYKENKIYTRLIKCNTWSLGLVSHRPHWPDWLAKSSCENVQPDAHRWCKSWT